MTKQTKGEAPIVPVSAKMDSPSTSPYTIEKHQHLYAAWAACRGASVLGCRFKVHQGRLMLESCGFVPSLVLPGQLPEISCMDVRHRQWRVAMIQDAGELFSLKMTHGVAAKLINLYLKCRFVCGGHHAHVRVSQLHPPIDSVMLKALVESNVGGFRSEWKRLQNLRWSKFTSDQYEHAIALIRQSLTGEPLWKN
ncbi:MAG: hypothetical protein ABL921_23460 [Pirellula sp.]